MIEIKEQKLWATPTSEADMQARIAKIADGSGNAAAVWTAVMLYNNYLASVMNKETA